jgi:hypothetical protein
MRRSERDTVALLGDAILLDPAHGSTLIRHDAFHELMSKSGGRVLLRRQRWKIVPRRFDDRWIRISLKRE